VHNLFYPEASFYLRRLRCRSNDVVSIYLSRARENVESAGVPLNILAVLCGIKPTSLSSAYREVMRLDSEKEARLFTISCRLLELKQALSPLELPRQAGSVERMVHQLESGQVTLDEIRASVGRMVGA
jgi:hypothetical protein